MSSVHAEPVAEAAAPDGRTEICRYLTENRKKLLGVIQRYETNPGTAEDILSTVTVELLANPQRFKFESSIGTYVVRVVKNHAVSHVRRAVSRKRVQPVYPPAPHELTDPDHEPVVPEAIEERTPAHHVEHRQTLAQVQALLPELQTRYPAAYPTWKLHRIDGLDYAEIQAQTGTPARVAFLHVFRVTQALEKLLAEKAPRRRLPALAA